MNNKPEEDKNVYKDGVDEMEYRFFSDSDISTNVNMNYYIHKRIECRQDFNIWV